MCVAADTEEGAGIGAWIVVFLEVDGVIDKSATGNYMCGQSRLRLFRSNLIANILGKYMLPVFSSTLMHQVLSSRDRRRRKCIGRILCSAAQSMYVHLSLEMWYTREISYSTIGWDSDHRDAISTSKPSNSASDIKQSM